MKNFYTLKFNYESKRREKKMEIEAHPEEAKDWVNLLCDSLRSRAVRVRGPGIHRGVVTDQLKPIMEKLIEQHLDVRREVIIILEEQGDELAIEVMGRLAKRDPEWRIRQLIAEHLARIGGPDAVEILKDMARTDPSEDVRAEAIQGLGNMALAEWPALAVRTRSVPRVRGGIRIRGAAPSKSISTEADAILELLDQIRFKDLSSYVRDIADDTLASLDE
jgi:HEAT repeat protein